MSDVVILLTRLDQLYADVVATPDHWNDEAFADWTADLASIPIERSQVRLVRRCVRAAQKLARFWREADRPPPADWRSAVDVALGPPAWRPMLDLARLGLAEQPSEDLFEEVKRRFRVVHSNRWMEGVTYDEWLRDDDPSPSSTNPDPQ